MKTKSTVTPAQQANIDRFSCRSGRTIVIKGVKWKWRCGTGSVIAYSEQGGLATVTLNAYGKGTIEDEGHYTTIPKDVSYWLTSLDPTKSYSLGKAN